MAALQSELNPNIIGGLDYGPQATDTAVSTYWPGNDGFLVPPTVVTLQPGTLVDRYGNNTGHYLAPAGTPFEMRSMPEALRGIPVTTYEVVRPMPVLSGPAVPWFGQFGLGTQYKTELEIRDLVKSGFLKER